MRCYNAAMRELAHIVAGLAFGVFAIASTRYWVLTLIYGYRAAANRKPGISWHVAVRHIVFGHEVYTEIGEKLADRARYALSGFFICWLLCALAGLGLNATASR